MLKVLRYQRGIKLVWLQSINKQALPASANAQYGQVTLSHQL